MLLIFGMVALVLGGFGAGASVVFVIEKLRKGDAGVDMLLLGVMTGVSLFLIFKGTQLCLLGVRA